jgi:hypothetical protein
LAAETSAAWEERNKVTSWSKRKGKARRRARGKDCQGLALADEETFTAGKRRSNCTNHEQNDKHTYSSGQFDATKMERQ